MSNASILAEAADFFAQQTANPEPLKSEWAMSMAVAEEWAKAVGVTYVWEDDWEVDHVAEFDCYVVAPGSCELVTAWLDGEIMASLGCVDDAGPEYRRFVEAELAQEALSAVTR